MTTAVVAPEAPGRLGAPVDPAEMLRYLEQLLAWCERRRAELDELDRRVAAGADGAALTGDVTLAMALWQAVTTRREELVQLWDDGRAGPVERRRLAAAVWGRRATTAGPEESASLAVSLPEACRLSDALTGQLRLRASLDPVGPDLAERLRALRAATERVRDLAGDQPAGAAREQAVARQDRLARRVADLTERTGRGGDVTGPLRAAEVDVAQAERDLMVASGLRRTAEREAARASTLRRHLLAQQVEAERLEAECVMTVAPAPRLAVPRVETLGPVPQQPADVQRYLVRLAAVERALVQVLTAYRAPLEELVELRGVAGAYAVKARAGGAADREEVADLAGHVHSLLARVPVDLPRARAALAAYRTLVSGGPDAPGGTA